MSKYNFLHLTTHIHNGLYSDSMQISGFYNWNLAFNNDQWNGEFQLMRSRLGKMKNYNIIFVCIAKPEEEVCMIDQIRREVPFGDPNTIVVGSIDYAVEIWDQPFNMFTLKHQLEQCDVITASEPALASCMKALMPQRKIHLLPHPSDVDNLKKLRKPLDKRQKNIVAMIHRYDNAYKISFLQLWDVIRRHHNSEEVPDIEAIILSGDEAARIAMLPYFSKITPGDQFSKQMEYLSRQFAVVDSYHRIHTYGRTVSDCAAIGVPLIGTSLQYLQNELFPDLCTAPYDLYSQQRIINKLIDDPSFYEHVVEYAWKRVDKYNYPNSVDRFLKVIEDEHNGICDIENGIYNNTKSNTKLPKARTVKLLAQA